MDELEQFLYENMSELEDLLEGQSDELSDWNSLFEAKDDDDDSSDEEKDDNKKESDDSDLAEDDSSDASKDTDENETDDSILNTSDGNDNSDTPPDVDEDPSSDSEAESSLDELSSKIKLSRAEIEILNAMIDSETDAISDYSRGLTEAKNKYVRKLLIEILSDESQHLAQLNYLKSLATDRDYVPKDQEAVDELAQTLESVLEELL